MKTDPQVGEVGFSHTLECNVVIIGIVVKKSTLQGGCKGNVNTGAQRKRDFFDENRFSGVKKVRLA